MLGGTGSGSMARSTLRSLVRDMVQEASTTPLSDAIIHDLLTQAEERLSDLAEYSVAKFVDTLATNDIDYELPVEALSLLSVAWEDSDGDLVPIEGPTTQQRMDAEFSSWRTDAADRPLRWWILGNALLIHPKPSATYNGTDLELYASIVPPAMSGDSSVPADLPLRFNRTLAKYAAWKWYAIDKENPVAQRMATFWQNEFQADAVRLRQMVLGRAQTDGPGLRIGRGRDDTATFGVSVDEDED